MNELAIIGTGAVTPIGLGDTAFAPDAIPVAGEIPSIRRPDKTFKVFRPAPEGLERWRREPRLRRASPITHLMVESATQAIADRKLDRLGLVGAFFSGACNYSRLFFEPVISRGPSFASPALFPDTVYNSSLSHVAHMLGVDGASYAIVGDDAAWTTALQVASTWLDLGEVDHVLVIGAEELDAVTIEAYDAAGWLKNGFVPAEGAAAMLLARPKDKTSPRITRIHDGIPHRSKAAAHAAAARILDAAGSAPVLFTAEGTWAENLVAKNPRAGTVRIESPAMGHAFTASAGWNTIRGIQWLAGSASGGNLWVPVWGLHNQFSAFELRSTAGLPLAIPDQSG